MLKNMYQQGKSCVKTCNTFSDFFFTTIWLRQGEVISPILVSLFLDDIGEHLKNNLTSNIIISDVVVNVIGFADHTVILGESPSDLPTRFT